VASFETIEQNHRRFFEDMRKPCERPVAGMGIFD
jgi:hypothetical protein